MVALSSPATGYKTPQLNWPAAAGFFLFAGQELAWMQDLAAVV